MSVYSLVPNKRPFDFRTVKTAYYDLPPPTPVYLFLKISKVARQAGYAVSKDRQFLRHVITE